MRWSIRYQLLISLFILLLGVVGISIWTGVLSAYRARERIETNVRNIAHTMHDWGGAPNAAILRLMKTISRAEYYLKPPSHEIPPSDTPEAVSTLPRAPRELPPTDTVVEDWEKLRLGPTIDVGGEAYLGSGVKLPSQSVLYILYPERLWRDALWEAIYPSLVLGGVGGVAAVLMVVGVSQRLGRRIRELERRTRLIAAGDFSPMPLPRRNDELRDLALSVNHMAQQLAKLQETVQQTERLRLLGQVGGGLAHQLRNSVTGARLAVQLHARACKGQGDAEALDVALRELTLVDANLKRFLDLGRKGEFRREPCSLTALIDEVVLLLRPQCRHAGIDLRWQPPADPATVIGDPSQLSHLLHNVIRNAVEAAGPGGSVDCGVRSAECGMRIEIIDSGPGPAPEVAERLFQPFVTGKREGIGLGLMVSRQVAEAHGGRIDWRREADRTCFSIEIPTGNQ